MPLGRFLEVSLAAADVAASLAFYESLGFLQASVGEAWHHPYAVVTDGRISIGLHAQEFPTPILTWTAPDLMRRMDALAAFGIDFDQARLDEVSLNEASFRDPSGQPVRLLEARTFSPPALAAGHRSALGYFEEFAIPTSDLLAASAFWERMGFVAFDPVTDPFGKVIATGSDLNLGFYDLDLRSPVLVFSAPDMRVRIAQLRERGHDFARRLPRGLAADKTALLQAPEGTQILLVADTGDE
jgi:hypothetical protein